MNAFHSGCIGDIIYSIPTMQALGVTTLYVDDRPWTKPIVSRIGLFSRLIEAQGIAVKKHERENIDVDLSTYRNGGMAYGDNISNRVARWAGVKIDLSKPWIKSGKNNYAAGKIIVSRGARWHGEFFPWREIVDMFSGDIMFIGHTDEYDDFCNEFGKVERLHTIDLYDVAEAISGASLFIGNQSSPNAIANALHAPSIVETCLYAFDCIYDRGNVTYCHDGRLKFVFSEKSIQVSDKRPLSGYMIKIEGKTLCAKDKNICIALTRADCYLRKLRYTVDQLTQMVEKY
jgi:hypothetical protein